MKEKCIITLPFPDELKRDPNHSATAAAAATTKRPFPHAATQLSDGLPHAKRRRGTPVRPVSTATTATTDQQPIKQQYAAAAAAAATDYVQFVGDGYDE